MRRTITHKRGRGCAPLLCGAVVVLTGLIDSPSLLAGVPLQPIASRNLSPVYGNLGIPVLLDARAPERGQWRAAYQLHWASHSLQETAPASQLEFDGETRRHDLRLRVGVSDSLSIDVNLPYVTHSGGQLDSLIDDWHGFWGLPDGYRDDQPQDRLRFASTARPGFLLDDAASGLGDAELGVSWRLVTTEKIALVAFAHAKLATGDKDRFTGSGEAGLGGGLRATASRCLVAALTCHGQLGVMDVGDVAYAPDADGTAVFASLSLAWRLSDAFSLVGQLDAHSAVYDAAPLDSSGAPLWGSLSLRWSVADGWRVDAGFSEDLAVGTAPDVTFLLGVTRGF